MPAAKSRSAVLGTVRRSGRPSTARRRSGASKLGEDRRAISQVAEEKEDAIEEKDKVNLAF